MSSTWKPGVLFGGLILLVTSAVAVTQVSGPGGQPGSRRAPGDLHQGRRADPAAVLSELPSSGRDRADVAADLRGRAAVGALDQAEGHRARDAAVAHRPERRHHEVQGRSVADRRRDRDHRQVGRRRRADGQSRRHAAAAPVRRHRPVAHRQAGPHRHDAEAVHPAGQRARQHRRRPRRPGVHGRHVHHGRREQAGRRRQLQGRAPLHHQPGRGSGRGSDRAVLQRIRARQERRHLPAELRPPDQGRHRRSTSTCT